MLANVDDNDSFVNKIIHFNFQEGGKKTLTAFQATAWRQHSKKTRHNCIEKSQMEYFCWSFGTMHLYTKIIQHTHFESCFSVTVFSFTYLSSSQFLQYWRIDIVAIWSELGLTCTSGRTRQSGIELDTNIQILTNWVNWPQIRQNLAAEEDGKQLRNIKAKLDFFWNT